jgi:hypothetical protein
MDHVTDTSMANYNQPIKEGHNYLKHTSLQASHGLQAPNNKYIKEIKKNKRN